MYVYTYLTVEAGLLWSACYIISSWQGFEMRGVTFYCVVWHFEVFELRSDTSTCCGDVTVSDKCCVHTCDCCLSIILPQVGGRTTGPNLPLIVGVEALAFLPKPDVSHRYIRVYWKCHWLYLFIIFLFFLWLCELNAFYYMRLYGCVSFSLNVPTIVYGRYLVELYRRRHLIPICVMLICHWTRVTTALPKLIVPGWTTLTDGQYFPACWSCLG